MKLGETLLSRKKKNLNPQLRRGVKVCPFAAKHIGEASGK
jgi:hypothetical protein